MRRVTAIGTAALLLLSVSALASAQTPIPKKSQTRSGTTKRGGWQADFHGTFMQAGKALAGDANLQPGQPMPTIFGSQSEAVASYFFGDGATLLNNVANLNQLTTARISPLDSILTTQSALRQGGKGFGFRIGHTMGSHALIEFSFDKGNAHTAITPDALSKIEAARTSFLAWFQGELIGSAANAVVSSNSTIVNNLGSERTMVVDVNINVGTFGRVTPFFTLGGGLYMPSGASLGGEEKGPPPAGTQPSFTLAGNYQFTANMSGQPQGVPMNETDNVTVTYSSQAAIIAVFGGGVQVRLAGRSGIRVDVRVHMAELGGGLKIKVSTNPVVVTSTTPKSFLIRGSGPAVQFSNNGPGQGPQSSLSFANDFSSFESSGKDHIVTTTVAYFIRF